MKKKKILSMAIFAISIMVTTSGILAVGNFTGKGQVVAATVTATSTATGTATGTPTYYPSSLEYGYIDPYKVSSEDQTVDLSSTVRAMFPKEFLSNETLSKYPGVVNLGLGYTTFDVSTNLHNLLSNQGYEPVSDLYDFLFEAFYNNGQEELIAQTDKPINISISLERYSKYSQYDLSKLKVIHINRDGSFEEMPVTVNDNNVTFTTSNFSFFIICAPKDSIISKNIVTTNAATTKGVKTSDSNNSIGLIALAVGSIIIGTTVIMVGINKKNKEIN